MRFYKNFLSVLVVLTIILSISSINAFATTTTQDGLEVTLTTDKSNYNSADDIVTTLTLKNTNDFEVTNVSLENILPNGYKVTDKSLLKKTFEKIGVNETVTVSVTYLSEETNVEPTKPSSIPEETKNTSPTIQETTITTTQKVNTDNTTVKTGYTSNSVIICLVIILISIICIFAFKKKKIKQILSLALVCTLILSYLSVENITVRAAEKENIININTKVDIVDTELKIQAIVTYDEVYNIETADTDNDGVLDYIEDYFKTDKNNSDTDNDGLSDYIEIFVTNTDPTLADTDNNGIDDANEDLDNDNLLNIEEIKFNTNPLKSDTDDDYLSDYDEISVYKTNPNKKDTDEDGLLDGDEIVLELNPLKLDSDNNNILDCDELFKQIIFSENYEEKIFDNNIATPSSIYFNTKGNINRNVTVTEYDDYLKGDERSYVGKPIEISNITTEIESGNISFTLSDDYTIKSYTVGDELTNGLLICYNNGEDTTPLETTFDENTKTLNANITQNGIYFVLDVIDWMNSLGMEPTLSNSISKKNIESVGANLSNINGQVDIVFVVDTTGSMQNCINNVKNNLMDFVTEIENAGITPSFALVDYRDITCDGKYSTNTKKNNDGGNWFVNAEDLKKEIGNLSVDGGGDAPETAIDALEMARQLDLRASSQKFFILVTDAEYKIDNNYGITSLDEMLNKLIDDSINVSVVSDSSYNGTYNSLYSKTGGVFTDIHGNFKNELLSIADLINNKTNDGYWIALNGLIPKIVKLDEKPSLESKCDTDGDTLLDNQELISIKPTKYTDVKSCLLFLTSKDVIGLSEIPVYEYYSSPVSQDTDKDELNDKIDPSPKKFNTWFDYDRDEAINYAKEYWDYEIGHTYEDKDYEYYQTGDCANFVSQCLYAGGFQTNSDWYYDSKGIKIFGHYLFAKYSTTWTVASEQYSYFLNNKNFTLESLTFKTKSDMIDYLQKNPDNIKKGDIMYLQWEHEEPHHAAIIDKVTDNDIYYYAHTNGRDGYPQSGVNQTFWNKHPEDTSTDIINIYIIHFGEIIITS